MRIDGSGVRIGLVSGLRARRCGRALGRVTFRQLAVRSEPVEGAARVVSVRNVTPSRVVSDGWRIGEGSMVAGLIRAAGRGGAVGLLGGVTFRQLAVGAEPVEGAARAVSVRIVTPGLVGWDGWRIGKGPMLGGLIRAAECGGVEARRAMLSCGLTRMPVRGGTTGAPLRCDRSAGGGRFDTRRRWLGSVQRAGCHAPHALGGGDPCSSRYRDIVICRRRQEP